MRTLSAKLLVVLALGLVICLPGAALAWSSLDQGYYDNYPLTGAPEVPIDKIEFFIVDGSVTFAATPLVTYASPGFSGWTVIVISPTHVVATYDSASGPTSATWYYQFTGPTPVPNYTLVWNAYGDSFEYGEIVQLANGSLYNPVPGYYFTNAAYVVPLPASVLLLGSGFLGLGLLGWRRKTG
jgi:hypothetical protein